MKDEARRCAPAADLEGTGATPAPRATDFSSKLIDCLGGEGHPLTQHFRLIEFAIDRASALSALSPAHREVLFQSVALVLWRGPAYLPDCVKRAHALELLERVIKEESLEPATGAEVLFLLSETALRAPLEHAAVFLCEQLFRRIFGPLVAPELPALIEQSEWPHRAVEIFSLIQEHYRVPSRKLRLGGAKAPGKAADKGL